MKKLILLIVFAGPVALYYAGHLNEYLPNDYKLPENTHSLIDKTIKPANKEVLALLKDMQVTRENLLDLKGQIGFDTLFKSLLDGKNFAMAGGLIYWESQEYIKGLDVSDHDFVQQYNFIQDKLSEHKSQILKESFELSKEVFKIELKNAPNLAEASLMALKVNFPKKVLADKNCFELQLAILQKKEFIIIKDIHNICLKNQKTTASTLEIVEYMQKNNLTDQIKKFYIPLQRKYLELPAYQELSKMLDLDATQVEQTQSE